MNDDQFDIEALPIDIRYVGETVLYNNWQCDEWRVWLSNKDGAWTTRYYTGLGLRGKPVLQVTDNGPPPQRNTLLWERIEKSRKPVTPSKASVLHSLFMDAHAQDYSFDEWCDNYGYDSDSIKALNIYKECLDVAQQLRRYFTAEQRKAIEEIINEM